MTLADNEDWRYRKAQQLGLTDTRPVGRGWEPKRPPPPIAAAAAVPPDRPRPPIAPPRPPAPQARAAPPARPGMAGERLAWAGGAVMLLFLAVLAGWMLNDRFGRNFDVAEAPTLAAATVKAPAPAMPPADVTAPAPADAILAPLSQPEGAPPSVPVMAPPPVVTPLAPPAPVPVARTAPAPRAERRRAVAERQAARPRTAKARAAAARQRARPAVAGAARPSFDCRRARSNDSRLICTSPDLAALDVGLARAYRRATRVGGDQARLDREQAAFLNARGQCQTAGCVGRLYERRLNELGGY